MAQEKTYCYTYFTIISNGKKYADGSVSHTVAAEDGVFDPAEITRLLGVLPAISWQKGDISVQSGKTYGFSRWSTPKSTLDTTNIEQQVLEAIQPLKGKKETLRHIKRMYDVSFVICIVPHIYFEVTPSLHFGAEVLEFCYLTGTEIDIDTYVYDNRVHCNDEELA